MLIDSQLLFSAAAGDSPTAQTDNVSTNIYDTGAAADAGIGEHLGWKVQVTAAVTSAGAPTVTFVLQTATDAAFTVPIDAMVSGSFLKAALPINAQPVNMRIPVGALKRYLRVVYRIGVTTLTAGTFQTFLTKNEEDAQQYLASGFTVG